MLKINSNSEITKTYKNTTLSSSHTELKKKNLNQVLPKKNIKTESQMKKRILTRQQMESQLKQPTVSSMKAEKCFAVGVY